MINHSYFAVFYVEQLYYIPQFLPLAKELAQRKLSFLFVIVDNSKRDIFCKKDFAKEICEKEKIPFQIGEEGLQSSDIEYLICGGDKYPMTQIPFRQTALIIHGIGTKVSAFTEEKNRYTIRFVEGDFRYRTLKKLYPDAKVIMENVGFSKLDSVLQISPKEKRKLSKKYGLDASKKTLLYAPTFYPSSLENMPRNFPSEFSEYNIIIKPHYFTYIRKKYRTQRRKLNYWGKYPNVYFATFEDYNLAPFFAIADLMISDESSAIFEFAALNKPVICNRFIRLRFSYRLFGKYKFKKRMEGAMNRFRDIGENVWNYRDLKAVVKNELANPLLHEAKRKEYTHEIIGPVDGKVSIRMADVLIREASKKVQQIA